MCWLALVEVRFPTPFHTPLPGETILPPTGRGRNAHVRNKAEQSDAHYLAPSGARTRSRHPGESSGVTRSRARSAGRRPAHPCPARRGSRIARTTLPGWPIQPHCPGHPRLPNFSALAVKRDPAARAAGASRPAARRPPPRQVQRPPERFDGEEGGVWRTGFSFRTVAGHPMLGEETFCVEKDLGTGTVTVVLQSWSRPGSWLTRRGLWVLRWVQTRASRAALDHLQRLARRSGRLEHGCSISHRLL